MINVIEKKCYQNKGNSVCVIKFNIDGTDKIYNMMGCNTFNNAFDKFYRKYKSIICVNSPYIRSTIFSVVGKAKCSPDDKFDVEKGMELAMQRAYQKVNAYNMKFIDMLSMELSDVMSILDIKRHCSNNQLCENVIKISELSK